MSINGLYISKQYQKEKAEMQARIDALKSVVMDRDIQIGNQMARIDALTAAAEKYSDNGHFPDCAVNDWTSAECTCGLAELEALLA